MAQTFNENVEASVLSIIFKDGSLYSVVEDILTHNSFGWKPFGIVYQSIQRIVKNDGYPDIVSVATDLENRGWLDTISIMSAGVSGMEALQYLKNKDVDANALETYAYQVQQLQAYREIIALADNMKRWTESKDPMPPSEILAKVDFETGKIATFTGTKSGALRNSKDVARASHEQFEKAANGEAAYIPTGIDAWDDFTSGLFHGRLYMISAASNDGKSSLALNIVNNLSVENGRKVFLLTLESGAEEINNKLIQIRTGIPSLRIEKGSIRDDEKAAYRKAVKDISDAPIVYDDSSELILPILRTKIRKAVADGAEVVIIDQLEQLLIGGGGDTQAEYIRINYMAYRVKAYAREMDVPIILIHQMNRSADSGVNRGKFVDVSLADLAQAGEKPCDAVLMIRHKKINQKIIESYFVWAKNRQGAKGMRQVDFKAERLLFKDIEGKSEFMPLDQMEIPEWAQGNELQREEHSDVRF